MRDAPMLPVSKHTMCGQSAELKSSMVPAISGPGFHSTTFVDPVAAMAADAPRVHETLEGNVVFHRSLDFGDVDGDFARAEHVVRRTARWHRMGAQPIETAGAVCSFDPYRQDMTVWSNSNFYNFLPWAFAGMLGVPNNRLRMIPCAVGGSFGSKHFITKVLRSPGR